MAVQTVEYYQPFLKRKDMNMMYIGWCDHVSKRNTPATDIHVCLFWLKWPHVQIPRVVKFTYLFH